MSTQPVVPLETPEPREMLYYALGVLRHPSLKVTREKDYYAYGSESIEELIKNIATVLNKSG